jgi:hypothetical protein
MDCSWGEDRLQDPKIVILFYADIFSANSSATKVDITRLLRSIDIIFSPMIRNIKSELLLESLNWASEGFVVS